MNLICTATRLLSSVEHMSARVINISGPPLAEWFPLAYGRSWLSKGHHAATDLGETRGKETANNIFCWAEIHLEVINVINKSVRGNLCTCQMYNSCIFLLSLCLIHAQACCGLMQFL